jgi:biopolymer transport protein ExbD
MATPVAALALVLTSISPAVRRGSVGLPIRPVVLGPCRTDDRRVIVVILHRSGRLNINSEESSWTELGPRLGEIQRTRWDKMVYVTADSDVPFQRLAEVIDIAKGYSYHVGLLPPLGQPTIGLSVCPEVHFRDWTTEPATSDDALPVWH